MQKRQHSYLRDWVYGSIDGAVTTFAVIAGSLGADLNLMVVVILGIANLLGDGFSMAAANFLGTKTEHDEYHFYKTFEQRQIDEAPAGEREEIRQIFINKGFDGEDLERIVERVVSDKKLWIKTMLQEEYGLAASVRSPWVAALSTFSAFLLCGLIPLVPFLFHVRSAFELSIASTGLVFFLIGSVKSLWSLQSWWKSGFLTLLIGGVAAILAFTVGRLFRSFG